MTQYIDVTGKDWQGRK